MLGEFERGSGDKPPTASLFKTMDPETITLETALELLTIPRELGPHPEDRCVSTPTVPTWSACCALARQLVAA